MTMVLLVKMFLVINEFKKIELKKNIIIQIILKCQIFFTASYKFQNNIHNIFYSLMDNRAFS